MGTNEVLTKKEIMAISDILDGVENGKLIFVDKYPNREHWDQYKKSRFIEAILMGVQIREVYCIENEDNTLSFVDSQERIHILKDYFNNKFSMINIHNLPQYNGMTFEKLPMTMRNKLRQHRVFMFVVSKDSYKEPAEYMCERINMGIQ